MYTIPANPHAPTVYPALESERHGALRIAAVNSTAQKCTMVGVANARVIRESLTAFLSAASAITTNCKPVRAPAEEPMIT